MPFSNIERRLTAGAEGLPPGFTRGSLTSLAGLTGQSVKLVNEQGSFVMRPAPALTIPHVNRLREGRLLRKLFVRGLTPRPLLVTKRLLVLPWQPGTPLSSSTLPQHSQQVIARLVHLHQQPPVGYPLPLLPLLERYWQLCQNRHPRWLRALQRLRRAGEPRPLRLAPLHLDVHAGNLLVDEQGIQLIDWEYALDGDIALELAALCNSEPQLRTLWLEQYAQAAHLPLHQLTQQVARWQPWLALLIASWYQLRAEQSGEARFFQLAHQSWQRI